MNLVQIKKIRISFQLLNRKMLKIYPLKNISNIFFSYVINISKEPKEIVDKEGRSMKNRIIIKAIEIASVILANFAMIALAQTL